MKPNIAQTHSKFTQKVWAATKKIPRGKVATYTAVAAMIGNPRSSRAVGNALSQNRDAHVPCHRVVRSDGSIGGFARGTEAKIKLLQSEGVQVARNKVLKKYII